MKPHHPNGLIIKNRGPKGDGIPQPETVMNNNIVLRKLKIALDLQIQQKIIEKTIPKIKFEGRFQYLNKGKIISNQFLFELIQSLIQ